MLNQLLRAAEMSQGVMSSRVLLGEFMDRWLEERVYPGYAPRPACCTPARCGYGCGRSWVTSPCSAWRRGMCRPWKSVCPVVAGPSVLQTCRQVLSTVLNYAVHLELVSRNPVNGMGAVGYHRREPVILDVESVMRVLRHLRECEPGLHAPCHFVAHTGMRIGEVLALRWDDVSLDGGI